MLGLLGLFFVAGAQGMFAVLAPKYGDTDGRQRPSPSSTPPPTQSGQCPLPRLHPTSRRLFMRTPDDVKVYEQHRQPQLDDLVLRLGYLNFPCAPV